MGWVEDAVVRQAGIPGGGGGSNMGMIIPAAIGAASSLGGAALGGKGAKQAAKLQMQSQDKALGFAREQEMARRQDWQQAMAAYNANRNALLQRYGISVPQMPQLGGNMASQAPLMGSGQAAYAGWNQRLDPRLRGGTIRDMLQG